MSVFFVKYMFVVSFPRFERWKLSKAICIIESLTLGIYVLDPCVKLILYDRYQELAMAVLPSFLVHIGWVLCSMVIGGGIT